MTRRTAWFVYSRPYPGKFSATPIHWIGWALLIALPFPGVAAGAAIASLGGPIAGLAATMLVTGVAMLAFFRLVKTRGRPAE
ncbi:hypothetical protein U1701_15695 [Sphingomonas sp. PB2P19]|uniref:hypothetical protein n=1 Tax=Sphingomonas rhamnosi TaxID=3096156 RepID=UPI002FCA8DF9